MRPDADHVLIDLGTMKAAVTDAKVVKLDVRDVDEWIGANDGLTG